MSTRYLLVTAMSEAGPLHWDGERFLVPVGSDFAASVAEALRSGRAQVPEMGVQLLTGAYVEGSDAFAQALWGIDDGRQSYAMVSEREVPVDLQRLPLRSLTVVSDEGGLIILAQAMERDIGFVSEAIPEHVMKREIGAGV